MFFRNKPSADSPREEPDVYIQRRQFGPRVTNRFYVVNQFRRDHVAVIEQALGNNRYIVNDSDFRSGIRMYPHYLAVEWLAPDKPHMPDIEYEIETAVIGTLAAIFGWAKPVKKQFLVGEPDRSARELFDIGMSRRVNWELGLHQL